MKLLVLLSFIAISWFCSPAHAGTDGQPVHVWGAPWMLAGRVYESAHLSTHPHLIVVLHGDAPGIDPTYQYVFARRAAAAIDDAVVMALLRPGFADGMGLQSQGFRGHALGDNYTVDRIDSIANAAQALMKRYHARDLTLVGHSGGAAISADVLALRLYSARAILVSCPCDVRAFRWGMLKLQWNPLWLIPVSSISPIDRVAQIRPDAQIDLIAGARDSISPPALTEEYAGALRARGIRARITILPGMGHEILLDPRVIGVLKASLLLGMGQKGHD